MATLDDIRLKKKHGQHFLTDYAITQKMINAVNVNATSSILEIGPGSGFLTSAILERSISRLWAFEIDPEWVEYLNKTIKDDRLAVYNENILAIDIAQLVPYQPWILLANLPYNITFPILELLQRDRSLFSEGVIMVQEEVAQKLVKTRGRGFGAVSLFYQRFFNWQLLAKIPPNSFNPPPNIFSRLLHFKPRLNVEPIDQEENFWKFVGACFKYPRQTLFNNIKRSTYQWITIPLSFKNKRAQELTMDDLIVWWHAIIEQKMHV